MDTPNATTAPSTPAATGETAPAAPATPAPVATGKVKLSRAELMAKLDKMRNPEPAAAESAKAEGAEASTSAETSDAGTETDPKATDGGAEDSSSAEASEQIAEAAQAEPPKQPGETQQQYAHRLAQAMLKAQRAESDALTHKRAAETATARVKELEALLEGLKTDPVKALAHAGTDPTALAQMMLDGKLKAGEPLPPKLELPPEVQELIEQGKQAKAKAEREAKAAAEAAVRAENVKIVDQARLAAVSEFPVLAAVPSEGLLSMYEHITAERGAEPDFGEVAAIAQKRVLSDIARYLSDPGVLKLVFDNADVKGLIAKELGLTQAARTAETPIREGANPAPAKAQQKQQPAAQAEATPTQQQASTITNRDVGRVPGRSGKSRSTSAELVARINQQILGK